MCGSPEAQRHPSLLVFPLETDGCQLRRGRRGGRPPFLHLDRSCEVDGRRARTSTEIDLLKTFFFDEHEPLVDPVRPRTPSALEPHGRIGDGVPEMANEPHEPTQVGPGKAVPHRDRLMSVHVDHELGQDPTVTMENPVEPVRANLSV